jgi:hypothetical protein
MGKDGFLDEKIIEMIDQTEKSESSKTVLEKKTKDEIPPEERTILSGLKVSGQWIEFEERLFMEGRVRMMVPKEFTEMDPKVAKIKYPMEQRPGTILTDFTGTINILFSDMGEPVTNEDAKTIRDQMLAIMVRINPGVKPQSTGEAVIAGKNIAYVEFSNPAMDGKLYNLMFFLEVDGKAMMGSISFLTKNMKYWKQPAFEMIDRKSVV